MADRLTASYWLTNFNSVNMLRHYDKALQLFPFSKLRKGESVFRIYALEHAEPALLDVPVATPVNVESVISSAREFQSADSCYELETFWDLWAWDNDWQLAPTRVLISCLGPEFENEIGDNLRIDFGLDEQFLPGPGGPEGMRMIQSNIQSLLRLVHDLDERLNIERRQLWSESGENFAERLEAALREYTGSHS